VGSTAGKTVGLSSISSRLVAHRSFDSRLPRSSAGSLLPSVVSHGKPSRSSEEIRLPTTERVRRFRATNGKRSPVSGMQEMALPKVAGSAGEGWVATEASRLRLLVGVTSLDKRRDDRGGVLPGGEVLNGKSFRATCFLHGQLFIIMPVSVLHHSYAT
jgi:hypothetical protein